MAKEIKKPTPDKSADRSKAKRKKAFVREGGVTIKEDKNHAD